MIRAKFSYSPEGLADGFEISGHSGYAEVGNDIVCAAVSSAAYMCANTLTEILGLKPELSETDGTMKLKLNAEESRKADAVLKGLILHLEQLSLQYPDFIKIERGAKNA
ncbi:MAG: ribosomal-processing cysteine protease Prp [Clostridiaceae bacterium]|nr:ribosomal-processing cysteine protease Prp [Clostridiaceae bacterium]